MAENTKNIRLRFAPSPTGFVHIGNLRTALFGYLISQSLGGKFILRVEDTDQKREVDGAVDSLLKVMDWCNITFDEGPHIGGAYGPYTQTKRLDKYKKLSDHLLREDLAYRCFCSSERLDEMRVEQEANKQAPRYDRHCRHLSENEISSNLKQNIPYVIRQKMPLEGEITVHDEIRGDISFKATDLDDHVLIKSNGVPTYQFANIVDDHLMEISHVTRGDEWLPSFPKNVLLYQAFGWTVPKFIHLPLILNKTGGKLSKRQGDVFVEDYKTKGYLPEAIINFCALLGWHGADDKDLYNLNTLKKVFSVDRLQKSPAVFDSEKLDYLNGYYIREKTSAELINLCHHYVPDMKENILEKIIEISKNRMKKLEDIKEASQIFTEDINYETELLSWKNSPTEKTKNNLEDIKKFLESTESWELKDLEANTISWIKTTEQGNGDYLWPLRVSLSRQKNSPSPFELAWVLGKEKTLDRIEKAISKL